MGDFSLSISSASSCGCAEGSITASCMLTDIDAREIDIGGFPDVPDGKVVDRVDVIVRVRSRQG